jgi:tRNA G18 (ribose-2'-O)-methylase SpoU
VKHKIAVLLHNVRSAHNVGSVFRTADAAGVSRIYLTGYTPPPVDRFGRVQKEIAKTALGAEKFISWTHAKDPRPTLQKLKAEGFHIVGVEQDARARDYRTFRLEAPSVFVFGNEVRGLSAAFRKECDSLIEIPMRGKRSPSI